MSCPKMLLHFPFFLILFNIGATSPVGPTMKIKSPLDGSTVFSPIVVFTDLVDVPNIEVNQIHQHNLPRLKFLFKHQPGSFFGWSVCLAVLSDHEEKINVAVSSVATEAFMLDLNGAQEIARETYKFLSFPFFEQH